jgi:type IV secretory pathway VirB2 component (pilin)
MVDDDRVLSEEQARRLWQRAAELQAEGARRLEERSRALVRSGSDDRPPEGGYRLAHVRDAAMEAGISEEFVELAFAEADGAGGGESPSDRWADRFLGRGPRTLVVSRTLPHAAAEVYTSMQRVLPRYRLSLVDSHGKAPLEGGVLVFDLPALSGWESSDPVIRDLHLWADVRELHVQIHPLDEGRSEVTLRAPVRYARKLNLAVGGALAGVAGLVGAMGGAALAVPIVSMLALGPVGEVVAVLLIAALGFTVAAGAGALSMRALYRWGQGRGEAALVRLLQALGVDLRTGGAFQPPPTSTPPTPPLPPASDQSPT